MAHGVVSLWKLLPRLTLPFRQRLPAQRRCFVQSINLIPHKDTITMVIMYSYRALPELPSYKQHKPRIKSRPLPQRASSLKQTRGNIKRCTVGKAICSLLFSFVLQQYVGPPSPIGSHSWQHLFSPLGSAAPPLPCLTQGWGELQSSSCPAPAGVHRELGKVVVLGDDRFPFLKPAP